MGVFATRSPYRPNPIGLSSVRLIEVRRTERTKDVGLELVVSGADVLDGTPIYDIKPYLSFSDCHEDAKNGFAEETRDYKLKVDWTDIGLTLDEQPANNGLRTRLSRANNALLEWKTHDETEEIKEEIEYILSQDPRPGYQDDPEREYKLDYKGWNVAFTVVNGTVFVKRVVLVESRKSKVESK